MRKSILIVLVVFILGSAMKSDKPAYQFYNLKGKDAGYKDVLNAALGSDIVFFGELHDSPICHWLELELTKDLYAEMKENLVIGAEMFESDNQLLLDIQGSTGALLAVAERGIEYDDLPFLVLHC